MQTAITNVSKGNLTPRASVEAVFRQQRLFWWIALTVVLVTGVTTVLKHRQYASEMKFLVQNTRGNVVITAERTTPTNVVSDVTETQVNSELEILHSHDVLDPVADPDWAKLPEAQRTAIATREHEKLITAFEHRLATDIVRKTAIITVSL